MELQRNKTEISYEKSILKALSNKTNQGEKPGTTFQREYLSMKIEDMARKAAIGTHHDTIPSTSRESVHESEMVMFKGVVDMSN